MLIMGLGQLTYIVVQKLSYLVCILTALHCCILSTKILMVTSKYEIIFGTLSICSFRYCSKYSYHSSNFRDGISWCSFSLLKAIAKSKERLIAITFKSKTFAFIVIGRETTIEIEIKKEQRNYTQNEGKKIKSDNFTKNNKEKSNNTSAILEK